MKFQQAYDSLNSQQHQAVELIEGPVMVIAGPGTGKTQILAMRIANILQKTDTSPSAILALTFTEAAAKNMQQRLISLIGTAAYAVHIQTFHGFCDEVIRESSEFFPFKEESQVLGDLERFEILEAILLQPRWQALRTVNSPFYYLKAIIHTLSELKRENVSPEKLLQLVNFEQQDFKANQAELKKPVVLKQTKRLAKMMELAEIYVLYQQELLSRGRYDYDDMIRSVAAAFEHDEDLLLKYQEKLQYFLIDEYQDTNSAQNKVVDLLASFWDDQANIFVVGDPNQSIYRFQGASLENTLNFLDRYPTATVIQLALGYRCPPTVYQAAAEVIAETNHADASSNVLLAQLAKPLESLQKTGALIEVKPAATNQLELITVAEEIRQLLDKGVPAQEIAILYRTNAEVADLAGALAKWQIPFISETGGDALQNPILNQFLHLLAVIAEIRSSREGQSIFEVMNYEWLQLDRLPLVVLTRAAAKAQTSIYDLIKHGYVEFAKLPYTSAVTARDFAQLFDFLARLESWSRQDFQQTFPVWFELVMTESGFLNWVMKHPEKVGLIQQLHAIFREVQQLAVRNSQLHLAEFIAALQIMRTHGLKISVEEYLPVHEAVTLTTAHKAKGQEWSYVFVIGCIDGKWGNSKAHTDLPLPNGILEQVVSATDDRNQDDARLFYVAITRAKTQVYLSYSESVVTGNRTKLTLPSMFIEQIKPELKNYAVQSFEVNTLNQLLSRLLVPAEPRNYQASERTWVQSILADFHLSATALNTYLKSPAEFYENELLRVPRVREPHQAFGTAVHAALEHLYRQVQLHQQLPTIEKLLAEFEKSLRHEVLSPADFALRLGHGQKILTSYYEQMADAKARPLDIEKKFGSGWSQTVLDDIPLTGRIDRIDWLDQLEKKVIVIDYKTGRVKTQNEIEGKVGLEEYSERELALPENIRGRLKRQLVFYKLLTELDHTFPATVSEGWFDFIEPDRDGKFTQRKISLNAADVTALKAVIVEVMSEIRALQFLEN